MSWQAQSIPLWHQLQAAASLVAAVGGGQSATAALDAVPSEIRPGVHSLAFQALRQLGLARALRTQLVTKTPAPLTDALLCTALALLCDPLPSYDVFTLVDQTVEAAKRHPRLRNQSGFINGCLRRYLRERHALLLGLKANAQAQWNHPTWWIERLKIDHPQDWQAILEASQHAAPMTLRVNRRRVSQADYLAMLVSRGQSATVAGQDGLVLHKPCTVSALPGFEQGWVSVQDMAAQMAAPLLLNALAAPPLGPMRILDACAAPGGKTAHMLELADVQVTALEVDPRRAQRLRDNLQRQSLVAEVLVADAARPEDWWNGQPWDGILLDAPCTASGIVRRHPDIRWLRRESDVAQLAGIQARMLQTLWPQLRPGGALLYCTCSVFRAEGDEQIKTFLAHNTDAYLLAHPGHLLPSAGRIGCAIPDNRSGDHDGFYYALLEKQTP